jgi:benzoyl-CoA-dihydrodiol lyase
VRLTLVEHRTSRADLIEGQDMADDIARDDDPTVRFGVDPDRYRHWSVSVDGEVATVTMSVDPGGGLRGDYELKTNSYDLGVDIELHDIVQRLRFEHPAVRAVVLTGGLDKIFCAGANIQMLATSSHGHKVNFCKFTNETRNAIEDATTHSHQTWIAAVNGTAAGGGYELALACDEILLIDDRASTVSLPEVPLLAVLPGTGGLTRVVDKRRVRRDLADVFATRTEGVKGEQAVEWRLVDAVAPKSDFAELVAGRAATRAAGSDRPEDAEGIRLPVFGTTTTIDGDTLRSTWVDVDIDRELGAATFTVRAPATPQPGDARDLVDVGAEAWLIGAALELDHAMLHLRFNETTIGTWVLRTEGSTDAVVAAEAVLAREPEHWLVREVRLMWARTLDRLDLSSRSIIALVDEGSCFAGTLAELMLAADRSLMLDGTRDGSDLPAPTIVLTDANLGWYPTSNGRSRLATRFWGRDDALAVARELVGKDIGAADAARAELVTFALDDIDWDDEVPVMLEERASFSPDALTAMEANLRFVGPETTTTKIFARLTAWQNWVFQRPNAVGPDGALRRFGTGSRPDYDPHRV